MSFTLTGTRYIGTGALPTPVLGYDLVATDTGNFYVSNSSATAWILVGSVNSPNLGMLPLTGGTMTGNVAGATGWAPNDSPNFTTTAKLNGLTLATNSDLANTSTNILNTIAPKISEAVAATTSSITVKGSIAMGSGILFCANSTSPVTIPLPTYPDGTTASESDCKWWVGLAGTQTQGQGNTTWWPIGETATSFHTSLIFSVNPTTSRTFAAYLITSSGNQYGVALCYGIIGVKS